MLGQFWRRRQRPFTCTDVDARVERVRDGRLPARETAALKAHVASCNVCHQRLKTEAGWLAVLQTTPAPARLTPTERRAMQQALGRQMRRGMIMRNIRLSVQHILVLTALVLVVGAVVWWQTAVAPTQLENPGIPSPAESLEAVASAGEQNTKPIAIQFAVNDSEMMMYEGLVQAFESENPNRKIQLVSVNEILDFDPASGNLLPEDAALRMAQSADVFSNQQCYGRCPANLVQDIYPFTEADPHINLDDFYPGAIQVENGRLSVLPLSLNLLFMYYHKDAFDAQNISYPPPDWTWEDFRSMAHTLTIRHDGTVSQWGFAQPFANHLSFIEGQLDSPLMGGDVSSNPRYTDSDVLEVVKEYTDLYLVDKVAPAPHVADVFALIQAGKVAMWPDTLLSFNQHAQNKRVGVAPLPHHAANSHSTPMYVNGLVMSAGAVDKEAAWQWMSFLSRQQPVTPFGNNGSLPARVSVAAAGNFWHDMEPELHQTVMYGLEHSFIANNRSNNAAAILNDAVFSVIQGEQTIEAALAAAAVAGNEQPVSDPTIEPPVVVQESTADTAANVVTFIINSSSDLEAFRAHARSFAENHPTVRLDIRSRPITSVNLPLVARGADCFQWFSPITEFEDQTAVLSLDPFVAADPDFDLDTFYPALVNQFIHQGQLWGIPAEVYPVVIEYNRANFNRAQVVYPGLNWSFADFLDTAVLLTTGDGDDKQYGFAADAVEYYVLLFMLDRLGAELINDRVTPSTITFNAPATIEAMRWYTNLTTEFGVKPVFVADPSDITNPEGLLLRQQLLNQGRVAMWTFSPNSDAGNLDPSLRETMDVGVAPLPAGSGSGLPPASGYYISANTSQRDICWQWIKFLSASPDIGRGLPANRAAAESAAYRQRVGNELASAYLAAVNNATGESTTFRLLAGDENWMFEAIYWLGRAYAQITNGAASVEDALGEAQSIFDAYRSCMIARGGFTNVAVRNTCIQEADPLLPTFLFERR